MSGTQAASYVRTSPVDALPIDDGLLLLYQREIFRLSLLGQMVYEHCEQPRTATEIADWLLEQLGAPPEGDLHESSRTVITQLTAAGVLQETPTTAERP